MLLRRRVSAWKAVGLTPADLKRARTISGDALRLRHKGARDKQTISEVKGTNRGRNQGDGAVPEESSECRTHLPGRNCKAAIPATTKHTGPESGLDEGCDQWTLSSLLEPAKWFRYLTRRGQTEEGEGKGNKDSMPKESSTGAAPSGSNDGGEKKGKEEKKEEGGDGPGKETSDRPPPESTPLDRAPVCCSCTKCGVTALEHTRRVDTLTFRTLPVVHLPDAPMLGLCLAPSARGHVRAEEGRLCGHTPCQRCTLVVNDQPMCACCASRMSMYGSGLQGAGRLPPRTGPPQVTSRQVRQVPHLTPARVRDPQKETTSRSPQPGGRKATRGVPEPSKSPQANPDRRNRGEVRKDELRDRSRSRKSRSLSRRSDSRAPRDGGHERVGEYEEQEEEEDPPSDREEESEGTGSRDDRYRRTPSIHRAPKPRPKEDKDGGEKKEAPPRRKMVIARCRVRGCDRWARGEAPACCEQCATTDGREHSAYCEPPQAHPPDRHRPTGSDDDEEDDDEDEARGPGGKGKKGKKGKYGRRASNKSMKKQLRDRERYKTWKGGGKAPWHRTGVGEKFHKALAQSVARSTLKSRAARLRTWDDAVRTLEDKEVLPVQADPYRMSPDRARKVVALLKARGYRSAELYLSAAMGRHKVRYPVDGPLELAGKEATRIAKRGRGPPQGKHPVPFPQLEDPLQEAIATGVWYLLRVAELCALNLGDVQRRHVQDGWQVALHIRSSKTDQEGAGALVARNCVCGDNRTINVCPVHTIWNHLCYRVAALREVNLVRRESPLFVDEEGRRLTPQVVLKAVEETATRQGEVLTEDGRQRFGTHSMRVAGAILAFQAGVGEETVRALGRWDTTKAMLGYLRGTPLVRAAGATQAMANAIPVAEDGMILPTNFKEMWMEEQQRQGLPKGIHQVSLEEVLTIRHGITGQIHLPGKMEGPPEGWTARCGWKWARTGMAGSFKASDRERCGRCFGLRR